MSQVHKEPLSRVENALPGRETGDIEIFGMEGIPAQDLEEIRQRTIAKYYAEHGPPVQQKQGPGKKIKKETPEELKARLALFRAEKAKRAAEKDNNKEESGQASSDAGQGGGHATEAAESPAPSVSNGSFHKKDRMLTSVSYSQTLPQGSVQHTPELGYPGYAQPSPGPAGYYPGGVMPDYMPPFAMPPQPFALNPYGAPPQQYPGQQPWGGPPQYMPPAHNYQFAGPPHQAPPGIASYSPPPQAFPHKPHHNLPSGPPGLAAPVRTPSLTPAPPGLPQKPSFTPSVSQFQLQQMHQGGGVPAGAHGQSVKHEQGGSASNQTPSYTRSTPTVEKEDVEMEDVFEQNKTKPNHTSADVDALIAEYAPKPAQPVQDTQQSPAAVQPAFIDPPKEQTPKDQGSASVTAPKGKKGKSKVEKTFKLKLQDNKTSPEEKLASSPRYSFSVETRQEQEREENTVLGEVEAQVTGPERGEVEPADKTG